MSPYVLSITPYTLWPILHHSIGQSHGCGSGTQFWKSGRSFVIIYSPQCEYLEPWSLATLLTAPLPLICYMKNTCQLYLVVCTNLLTTNSKTANSEFIILEKALRVNAKHDCLYCGDLADLWFMYCSMRHGISCPACCSPSLLSLEFP